MFTKKIWERSPRGEYSHMRIPGITVTSRGDIIIYAEARRSGGDWAEIDIVARRSRDGGKTFGEPQFLARSTSAHPTVNNPVIAEDAHGALHFLYCEDYGVHGGKVLQRVSRDGGEAFGEPKDITAATLPDYRNVFALGPGHGICTVSGTLAFPFWLVPKKFGKPETAHVPSEAGVLYSRDNGKTWHTTTLLPARDDIISPNETVAAEIADGSIYLAIRQNAPARAYALLASDFSSFCEYAALEGVRDPICFGSVVSVRGELAFVNCDHTEKRENLTLRKSRDGGKTWQKSLTLDASRGGYADIAYDSARDKIYVIYENEYGKELYFAVLDKSEAL